MSSIAPFVPPFLFSCLSLLGEFATYLNFCRSLWFEDKPNYPYLRELHKLGYTYIRLRIGLERKESDHRRSLFQPALHWGRGSAQWSNLQLSSSHSCRDEYAELEGCNDDRHPQVNSISPHPQVSICMCRKVRELCSMHWVILAYSAVCHDCVTMSQIWACGASWSWIIQLLIVHADLKDFTPDHKFCNGDRNSVRPQKRELIWAE